MTIINPLNPERFTPLVHPSLKHPTYVHKIFEDPDFIGMHLEDKKMFDIRWASNASMVQSLELFGEIIDQANFCTGTIALRHTFGRQGQIMGGANQLHGEAEDIMDEVRDAGVRVIGYSLSNSELELKFLPSWPKTYHDMSTNEVVLRMKRTNKMARHITDQTISLTAMEGLRSSADQTLDEFAKYLPILRG